MNRIRVVYLRPWRLATLLLAASCAFALADAGGAVDVPPGPATIHVEVIGAGHDIGLPPASFQLEVTSAIDGSSQTVERFDLTTSDGSTCPGVGPLCSGDVQVTAAPDGTEFRIDTTLGPNDRVPVYSGDCNGAGRPSTGTFGGLTVARLQTKTCRVTFVRPDLTAGDTPDSALLVTKTFEADPNGHPDGHLELFLPTDPFSPSVSWLLHDMRNSGGLGSGLCPLLDPAPVCELAITLGGDIWDPQPPRLDEDTATDWLPIFGGDCDRLGQLVTDVNPDGDLFQCTVDNVHLEAQSDTGRNAIVRLQVDAPGDTSSPPQNAQLVVLDHNFVDVADIDVKSQMRLDDGTACQGLGTALCIGDVGVTATAAPENFIVEVGTAPAGYTESFSGDCTAGASGDKAQVTVGKGQLATCHVTFTPPPAPPTMQIAPASGERNSSFTASSVDPCPAGTGSVQLTYIQRNPQGTFANTVVVAPAADGSWSNAFTPTHTGDVTVDASCLVVTRNPDGSTTETQIDYIPGTWTFLAEPPVVTVTITGPNGGAPDGKKGWFVSGPVTGSVSADDTTTGGSTISTIDCGTLSLQTAGLGTPTAAATFSVGADGITGISCTATDSAGNTSVPAAVEVKLDTHAPVVTRNAAADACTVPGSGGWCRGTQTAGFTAADTTSGVASPCAGASCGFTQSTATEGVAVKIASGAVCDVAGNCNPGIDAGPFHIDPTPPTLAPTISPSQVLLHGSATAIPNATDVTSGLASQSCGAVDTSTPGIHTLTCTAADVAGNIATAQVSYVVEYKIVGLFSPAPNSKWKQGQNVPVKFALADANGVQISDSDAQSLLSPTCRVMFTATGAQTFSDCFKFDTVKHQFVYDWKLGPRSGNETITARVSYPGTTAATSLSEAIAITG